MDSQHPFFFVDVVDGTDEKSGMPGMLFVPLRAFLGEVEETQEQK